MSVVFRSVVLKNEVWELIQKTSHFRVKEVCEREKRSMVTQPKTGRFQ